MIKTRVKEADGEPGGQSEDTTTWLKPNHVARSCWYRDKSRVFVGPTKDSCSDLLSNTFPVGERLCVCIYTKGKQSKREDKGEAKEIRAVRQAAKAAQGNSAWPSSTSRPL